MAERCFRDATPKGGESTILDTVEATGSVQTRALAAAIHWQPRTRYDLAGVLEKYEKVVGPANEGAVTEALEWPYEEIDRYR